MLTWTASLVGADAPFTIRHERQRGRRMSLAWLTHTVKLLIVSRAADFARMRQCKRRFIRRGRDFTPRRAIRIVIGSRVRRALHRKGARERIAALIHALKHLDAFAAIVAKRMRRRLTRIWPILTAPHPAAAIAPLGEAPAFLANSS